MAPNHPDRHCPDCGVAIGEPHEDGCDVARCLVDGIQRLQCDGIHDCGDDYWPGRWPDERHSVGAAYRFGRNGTARRQQWASEPVSRYELARALPTPDDRPDVVDLVDDEDDEQDPF